MTRKGRRLAMIGAAAAVLGVALTLILVNVRDNIVFFYGPTEIAQKNILPGTRLRIGGLVETGSVVKSADQNVAFAVTDGSQKLSVAYRGQLPDLFREGQGVVAEGVLIAPGQFRADSVLAKHDENYMPKEVADTLKKQGHWQEGQKGEAKK